MVEAAEANATAVDTMIWDTGEAVAEAEEAVVGGGIAATILEIVAAAATGMAAEAEVDPENSKQLRDL